MKHAYQLALQFPQGDLDDLDHLETTLRYALEPEHLLDGHDIGSGEMNLFIHTNDPSAAFSGSMAHMQPESKRDLRAGYRKFSEDTYVLLWPEGSEQPFSVV